MAAGPLYVGAAWSRESGSWLVVAFDPAGFDHAAVFEEVGGLWLDYEDLAERILVNVPVGLRERGDPDREAERLARGVLGARGADVFAAPVREAAKKRRFTAAARVNERKTGQRLDERAFEVTEAIASVDELLQEIPEARPVVAEAHPEVCFRAFAGDELERPRSIAGGYAERMRALATFDRDGPPTVQKAAEATGENRIAVADVLDAVALAYTAAPGPGDLRSLPPEPPTDPTGLPMQMVYRSETPLVEEG